MLFGKTELFTQGAASDFFRLTADLTEHVAIGAPLAVEQHLVAALSVPVTIGADLQIGL